VYLSSKKRSPERCRTLSRFRERNPEIEREIAVARNDISNSRSTIRNSFYRRDMDQRSLDISVRCEELQANSARLSDDLEEQAKGLREKSENLRPSRNRFQTRKTDRGQEAEIFRVSDE